MKFAKTESNGRHRFQPLPEKLLLRNARLVDPGAELDSRGDILIENGTIRAVGKIDAKGFDGETMDLKGKVISPGWMDMHTHLREPGREDEETIESGALAAANGGFTAVCCMPNTKPAIDSQEIIQYISDRARELLVDVLPIAAITKNREGKELAEILDLVDEGAVAISDDDTAVMNTEVMRRALEYSKMVDIPVIGFEEDVHMTRGGQMSEGFTATCLGLKGMPRVAEEVMIARDIMLTEYTGSRFHVAHISTAGAVELVRQAKARGVRVTAEAAPHHFTLTDEVVRSFNTDFKVRPPLREESDRQAIISGLKDGTIDAIASDHAPHSWEEKAAEFIYAPFGIVGLETTLGLSLSELVHGGHLELPALIAKFALHPYRILGVTPPAIARGEAANLTVFDPDATWTFDVTRSLSKSANTPFADRSFTGRPLMVINNGRMFRSIL